MADRYISEKSLIEEIVKIKDLRTLSTKTIGEAISNVPTADVVEVVRCKDCKYLTTTKIAGDSVWICKNAKGMVSPDPDLYCSFGERKEEERYETY